jgi:hypothetical protein
MTPNDWAALAVAFTSLIGAAAIGVRHLVKHYLSELRPNGGSSVKDSVLRLETKVQTLNDLVMELVKK